jgi:hypothetical protein
LSFRHEADQIICKGPSAQLKKMFVDHDDLTKLLADT